MEEKQEGRRRGRMDWCPLGKTPLSSIGGFLFERVLCFLSFYGQKRRILSSAQRLFLRKGGGEHNGDCLKLRVELPLVPGELSPSSPSTLSNSFAPHPSPVSPLGERLRHSPVCGGWLAPWLCDGLESDCCMKEQTRK